MPKAIAAFTFIRQPNSKPATHLFLSLALLIFGQFASAQAPSKAEKAPSPRIQEKVFHSKELDRDMHYMVVLPVAYDNSQQRYPVLYLLHGWAGDYTNWVRLTKLVEYSRHYPMIIVTPDAQ